MLTFSKCLVMLPYLFIMAEVLADKDEPFNKKFQQDDYKLKWEWGEVLRYNKRYLTVFSGIVFKYNRTCTAGNLTYEYNIDMDHHVDIVVQAYKYSSNEYREFPMRMQVNFCLAMSNNLMGGQSIRACGNYTRCTTLKGVRVHICNWAPDQAQFPPFIPSGRYKLEMQGLYHNEELFAGAAYGEVYRPFSGK